ncbi:MAG: M1 family metallopeptidase [Blastocatellia bacterium]|nr:M1 family metallopeptidase [Blastocatellia bacterium]
MAEKQAFGTATITFSPLNSLDKFTLDAGFMAINSIKLSEKSLKFDYAGGDKNDNLKITLDRIYQSNEEVTVKIDYRTNWVNEVDPNSLGGNNGKGLRFNAPTSNDPIKVREIWSFGEPESNRCTRTRSI